MYQTSAYFQVSSTNATDLFLDCTITWVFNGITKTRNIISSMNMGIANLAVDNMSSFRVDAGSAISYTITVGAGVFGYLPMIMLARMG